MDHDADPNYILKEHNDTALHVANRIRAGILEPGTVKILKKAGIVTYSVYKYENNHTKPYKI